MIRQDAAFNAFLKQDPSSAQRLSLCLGQSRGSAPTTAAALSSIDRHWSRHLSEANDLREVIHLRRIGGQDPLYEFQKLIFAMFAAMDESIQADKLDAWQKLAACGQGGKAAQRLSAPSATWSYLINDNPFDPMLEIELKGNIGLSAWAGLLWPLTGLYFLAKKIKNRKKK